MTLDGIPKAVVEGFRNQKEVIGSRGQQVSGILKMFHTITTTKRTFICVDTLDECVPQYRMVIPESPSQILQGSLDTRIFITEDRMSEGRWKGNRMEQQRLY